jgi:hypothetical protein
VFGVALKNSADKIMRSSQDRSHQPCHELHRFGKLASLDVSDVPVPFRGIFLNSRSHDVCMRGRMIKLRVYLAIHSEGNPLLRGRQVT